MVLKNGLTPRRKKSTLDVEYLDDYSVDDEGFFEGDVVTGKVLWTFSFGSSASPQQDITPANKVPVQKETLDKPAQKTQNLLPTIHGITPTINGENLNVKRSYQLRPSTVRKLNELKAAHPDVNVLFNTIVDMAISHYYSYIINEKGSFD